MKRNDFVSITIPASESHIPIAVFAARRCAENTGFLPDDVGRICLALEEGVHHALEFGYGGPQETVQTDISRTTLGLQLTIRFHGLPLEVGKMPRYDPALASEHGDTTGMSLLLIEKMMDKSAFSSLPGGRRSVSMEKHLPARLADDPAPEIEGHAPRRSDAWTLRMADPDDAEGISRLAFQSHGGVLFSEHIYYPDRVREMILAGEMTSAVIEADDTKEVAAHGAMVKHAANAVVEELTFGFVAPDFRSKGCASSLVRALEENAVNRDVYAIEAFAVTNHVHSQRAVLGHGYRECGLLVDTSPASRIWGTSDSAEPERIGNVIFTKYLGEFRDRPLYLPEHHRTMIERIYQHRGITVQSGMLMDQMETGPESTIWTFSDLNEGWSLVGIDEYGLDGFVQVEKRLQRALAQGIVSIQLALPLENPGTMSMTSSFEEMGFFFAGVGPDYTGSEMLMLQYVNAASVDYERIKVHSEFAEEIKQYVRSRDPRV